MVTFARKRKLKIGASQNKIKFGVSKETTKGRLPQLLLTDKGRKGEEGEI